MLMVVETLNDKYEDKMAKSDKGGNAFKKIVNGEVAEWLKATVC